MEVIFNTLQQAQKYGIEQAKSAIDFNSRAAKAVIDHCFPVTIGFLGILGFDFRTFLSSLAMRPLTKPFWIFTVNRALVLFTPHYLSFLENISSHHFSL